MAWLPMALCTCADPGTESILGSVTGACAWRSGWRLQGNAQPVDRSEPDGGRRFAVSPCAAAVSAEPNWLSAAPSLRLLPPSMPLQSQQQPSRSLPFYELIVEDASPGGRFQSRAEKGNLASRILRWVTTSANLVS
ncbi:uncharacterized protein M421DRAFT_88036 [Didymella exigua CBS 183.55]|uniref:Uncharacterized protein n=1 Tax=Didymella exigua CBS 183.55 TaxID=1150837 RepID=A0A6A5S2X8_9PLEO|nr:uncharacterized protein M421DRAFT_88036 [Didymella exigua CBS 183.55]KAF1933980.1 hypothetical protein M421DRAFT_88036 [Didymella exigua CBS 183.55]